MSKEPRKRAAKLGVFIHEGAEHRAWYKGGRLMFRRKHGRRVHAFTLADVYATVSGQRLLGI